jgi:hypothetical protein
VVVKVEVHLGKGATADSKHHPMRTVWATNSFDSVFAPAGEIGVREENCVLDPSRIHILGLAFGYRSPCHYSRACSKLGSRSCSIDHVGASGSEDEDAAAVCAGTTRKRKRKRKSPSALWSGQVSQRPWQHQQPAARPGEHMVVYAVDGNLILDFDYVWVCLRPTPAS